MTDSDIDDRDERTEAMPANEPAAPEQPDELTRLQAEHADMRDRVLRTLAEMENLRKRTEREVADARAYAVTAFARDLLSVGDNLDRALSSVPQDEAETAALKALSEGVAMTGRELQSTLAKHGVTKIELAPGERFDPNLHQAMFEVPDPNQVSGSVVQVVVPGFALAGRLLRPAMVGVSKGGPKTAPAPEGATIDRTA